MGSDFAKKTSKPTTEEYLKATEEELIERLNNNPGELDSEAPFIKAVLDVKTANSIRETNRSLVFVTWILCFATILAAILGSCLANCLSKGNNSTESSATLKQLQQSPTPLPTPLDKAK